jgi:hypothetical protein
VVLAIGFLPDYSNINSTYGNHREKSPKSEARADCWNNHIRELNSMERFSVQCQVGLLPKHFRKESSRCSLIPGATGTKRYLDRNLAGKF